MAIEMTDNGIVGIKKLMDISVNATDAPNIIESGQGTIAGTLLPHNHHTEVSCTTSDVYTLTLPSPHMVPPGTVFTIRCAAASGGGYFTVTNGAITDTVGTTGEVSAWQNANGLLWCRIGETLT